MDNLVPGQTPAPAAPAAPEATPAPQAPATPTPEPEASAQPEAPVAPSTPTQLSPEEAAAAEAKEWEDAAKEVFPNAEQNNKQEPTNEPAKPKESTEENPANKETPAEKKPDAESGDGDDAPSEGKDVDAKNEAAATSTDATRDARAAARQSAEQAKAVVADVRSKMFADLPEHLQDADGDPIRTIDDVMKLINPRTGQAFTEEQAGIWLLAAQKQFNEQRVETEKKIEHIAEVNIALKDEADYINGKYGEILKNDTTLRDQLWAKFEKTLVKDPASGVIVDMPMSLEEFYEVALEPRLQAQQKATADAEAANQAAAAAAAKAEADKKAEAERQRQRTRTDRSDIYAPPSNDILDPEDREWAAAADEVFGNQLKR